MDGTGDHARAFPGEKGTDMKRLACLLLTAGILAACQTTGGGKDFVDDPWHDIQRTLDKGVIRASNSLGSKHKLHVLAIAADIKKGVPTAEAKFNFIGRRLAGRKVPVVLFLHGCGGYTRATDLQVQSFMGKSKEDFVLVAPRTFGRARPPSCTAVNSMTWFSERSFAFRIAEMEYALKRLAELPWVDRNNIFLMGHSQGGAVAAEYDGDIRIRGRILNSGACGARGRFGWGNGIEDHERVIAFHAARDPWNWIRENPHCVAVAKRNGGTAVVDTELVSHDLITWPQYAQQLADWLRDNIVR